MKNNNSINIQINYLEKINELTCYKLSNEQIDQFKIYLTKLLQWNKRINLVSMKEESNIVSKHFLESIAILDVIDFPDNCFVIDVGTGAGFPGLPLKIVRPDLNLTLLDSRRFKILFIYDILKALDSLQVTVVNERAEVACLQPEFNQKFDFVVIRAVADLVKIYHWTHNFLKPGATIVALKGGDINKEIEVFKNKYNKVALSIIPLKSELLIPDRETVLVKILNITQGGRVLGIGDKSI